MFEQHLLSDYQLADDTGLDALMVYQILLMAEIQRLWLQLLLRNHNQLMSNTKIIHFTS